MAGGRKTLLVTLLLVLRAHSLRGAKILTICFVDGSHFLLMDEISRILQDNGHDVRMFRQIAHLNLPGSELSSAPYAVTSYTMEEKYLREYEEFFKDYQNQFFNGSYKTSAMKQRLIFRSRPFPPDKQLVGWVEHIIQSGGGGHLRPYSYQQPWYQQYLLDVILFISAFVAVIIYLIVKVIRLLIYLMSSNRKQKQN